MKATVYVGIDVHKRSYSFTAIIDAVIVKNSTVNAQPINFVTSLKKWFPDQTIKSVYEAGCTGFTLHRILTKNGIENVVVNPASVAVARNDKVKTDKLDSKKLAIHLSKGLLGSIYIPSAEEQAERSLVRIRQQLVDHRTMVSNQIKSFLLYHGLSRFDDNRAVSSKFLDHQLSRPLKGQLKKCLQIYAKSWRELSKQIYEIEKDLEKQAEKKPRTNIILRSVPGLGLISASTISTELGDIVGRFPSQKKLFSYLGLTPTEYSSGDKVRRGHISRRGPPRLRRILTEMAWVGIKRDDALAETFQKIASRRGKKIAIVAIARKIAGRVRACYRQDLTYAVGVYM